MIFYCKGCKELLSEISAFRETEELLKKCKKGCKNKEHSLLKLQEEKPDLEIKLGQELNNLGELREKDSYIKRIKRRTQDFQDSVSMVEKNYNETIEKRKIHKLNAEIANMKKSYKELSRKFESNKLDLDKKIIK